MPLEARGRRRSRNRLTPRTDDYSPLPAALVPRRTQRRLFCRDRQRRAKARVCLFRGGAGAAISGQSCLPRMRRSGSRRTSPSYRRSYCARAISELSFHRSQKRRLRPVACHLCFPCRTGDECDHRYGIQGVGRRVFRMGRETPQTKARVRHTLDGRRFGRNRRYGLSASPLYMTAFLKSRYRQPNTTGNYLLFKIGRGIAIVEMRIKRQR